jgi:hypothetical protein
VPAYFDPPSWGVAAVVAVLLSGLTVAILLTRCPPDTAAAQRVFLWMVVPATVWAWESVLREVLRQRWPLFPWARLDLAAGLLALVGMLMVVRWLLRGKG